MTETEGLRTHVWTDETSFETLVALDENSLYIASPDEPELSEIAEQIRSGTSPASALKSSKPKEVQLDSLKHIKSNRHSTLVYYKYLSDSGKEESDNFTMNPEERDELFAKLNILCSLGYKYTETQFNKLRAALRPLITISLIALFTLISYNAAIQIAEGDSVEIQGRHVLLKRLFAWLLDVLGPTGVIITGSVIVVLCFIWLGKRVSTPPLMLEYKKAK